MSRESSSGRAPGGGESGIEEHETLRRLMHAVIDHHAGRLNDDATVLMAEWRAGHQHELTP